MPKEMQIKCSWISEEGVITLAQGMMNSFLKEEELRHFCRLVDLFARATTTKHHRVDGLNNRNVFSQF